MNDAAEGLRRALASRYRIERQLGAGGMATVYLAHDLRHDRDVAIKLLHPELAAWLGADRFLSEIKTTARLQHPHILPLLDSGESDGLLYYVMPFVSGETLRTRLEREKQLPLGDALRIATEVADALTTAHAVGIIHRDIKPENILLQGEHAMVADFGIALAMHHAGAARMTQTGMSLGTPQYMSPEQAVGEKTVDARTDVYALGAVTYEMLAGEPPFTGNTVQAVLAKLMTDPPRPLRQLRKSVPPHVEAAVLSALEKLPADRTASAAAFAHALANGTGTTTRPTAASRPAGQRDAPVPRRWLLAAVTLNLILLAAVLALWQRPASIPGTSRQSVLLWRYQLPPPLEPGVPYVATQAAIAPNGLSIVYSDSTATGIVLMRKLRDAVAATPIAGTEGGISPFFSPDGKWVGYITLDGRLRKVPVAGGGSVTLAEDAISDYRVAAWLDDQTILYTDKTQGVARLPADGGSVVRLRVKEQLGGAAVSVASLWALPGASGCLLTVCRGNCAIEANLYVYDFTADSARLLVPRAAGGWYSPTGHLLYTSRDGGLYAVPFDLRRLVLRPGAVPVIEGVEPLRFTLSASGTALYSTDPSASSPSELVWVTRDGRIAPFDSTWRARFEYPALSPDGSALAVSVRGRTTDLWVRRSNGSRQKIVVAGAANWRASWMPDGQSFAFISVRDPEKNPDDVAVYRIRADGSGGAELLHRQRYGVWEAEVSRDGRWMVVRTDEDNGSSLRARRLNGDTTLVPIRVGEGVTLQAALSPDGRWLAYVSNESGQYEIYVASFPDMTSKRLVSRGGGTEPRWARNGRELYFKSGGQLVTVSLAAGRSFTPGNPQPLFPLAGFREARNHPQYDVAADGRFVMIRESSAGSGVVYAERWLDELRTKLKH